MKILLIPDSFKGSASSKEIIEALERGFKSLNEEVTLFSIIASDGGEGFLDAVDHQLSIETVWHDSLDPIGRPIEMCYLFDPLTRTAYIELAKSSGLDCLDQFEQNPMTTTTVGTGMQIRHAVNKGANKVYIGLGGSATNDGGIGLASVLGYSFLDASNSPILPIGKQLNTIDRIEGSFAFDQVEIIGINDVDNPLYGERGAAFVYAKQKGASDREIHELDKGLRNLAAVVDKNPMLSHSDFEGAGAAGGVGYGLRTFCNAKMISGTDFLFELTKLESFLRDEKIEVIITGEGKLDDQTMNGKLIQGLLKFKKRSMIKVVAICGQLELDETTYRKLGLDHAIVIGDGNTSIEDRIANALKYIEETPKTILSKLI